MMKSLSWTPEYRFGLLSVTAVMLAAVAGLHSPASQFVGLVAVGTMLLHAVHVRIRIEGRAKRLQRLLEAEPDRSQSRELERVMAFQASLAALCASLEGGPSRASLESKLHRLDGRPPLRRCAAQSSC